MRPIQYSVKNLKNLFQMKKVLTLPDIKKVLRTNSKMTINRKLKSISYRTSYSHAGRYYTLDKIARYNNTGLWEFNQIYFSKHGTLERTIEYLINASETGYFSSELKNILKVFVYNALLKLFSSQKIQREQIGREYVYLSTTIGDIQFNRRKERMRKSLRKQGENFGVDQAPATIACMKRLLFIMNEKQRRLFLGYEAMKLGYGGDKKIAFITGMNVKTISRGRRELLSHNITPERIRGEGAGRPNIKKK